MDSNSVALREGARQKTGEFGVQQRAESDLDLAEETRERSGLAADRPDLADQWHPTKNGDLTPDDVHPRSGKKVWWKGACGHEWRSSPNIRQRTAGTGCRVCAGLDVLPGFNDLGTIRPDLAAEWHPTKNGDLTPERIGPAVNRKVWWKGACGHEWETTPGHRNDPRTPGGCPYCHRVKVLPGFNDLSTTRPDLADQWHPTKNGDLTPHEIFDTYRKQAWWLCPAGHETQTTVANKAQDNRCLKCKRGGSFADKRPDLAAQWHPTKNDSEAGHWTSGSAEVVWWRCDKGHEWQAQIRNRNKNTGSGCPLCRVKTKVGKTTPATRASVSAAGQRAQTKR